MRVTFRWMLAFAIVFVGAFAVRAAAEIFKFEDDFGRFRNKMLS